MIGDDQDPPSTVAELLAGHHPDRPVGEWVLAVERSVPEVWDNFLAAFDWVRPSPAERRGWRVFDLRLSYGDADHWFPAVGRVRFESNRYTLIITLELFSRDHGVSADRNRVRLRESLADWERIEHGRIVSWKSVGITGADRYGFADEARIGPGEQGSAAYTPLPDDLRRLTESLLDRGFQVSADEEGPMGFRNLRLARGETFVILYGERAQWWLTINGRDIYTWREALEGTAPPRWPRERIDEPAYLLAHLEEIAAYPV